LLPQAIILMVRFLAIDFEILFTTKSWKIVWLKLKKILNYLLFQAYASLYCALFCVHHRGLCYLTWSRIMLSVLYSYRFWTILVRPVKWAAGLFNGKGILDYFIIWLILSVCLCRKGAPISSADSVYRKTI
jgi:hypothetical protein